MNRTVIYDLPVRIWKIINVLLITSMFALVWYTDYSVGARIHYYRRGDYLIIFLYAVLYFAYARSYDGFHISTCKISEIAYSQILSLIFTNSIMFIFIWLITLDFPQTWPIIMCFVCQITLSCIWATLMNKWYFTVFKPRKSLIVYDSREGMDDLIGEYGLDKKFEIQKTIHVSDLLRDLSLVGGLDTVFISGVRSHDRNIILKYCIERGIGVYVIPRVGDVIMAGASKVHMFHLPMLRVGRYRPVPEYVIIKRVFDIVVSLCAAIVLSPFMLITAIAVKSDGGPALYKQKRLTKDGKEFYILKFRSMSVDAEKDGVARLSTGDKDDRITKVGHIIRAIRFDELPQIFNILRGDMSIVGPRPERPEIAAQYEEEMPEFRLRLQAKAGLTGYAQVYGKYNTSPYDKLLMDLMYIANPSLIEDIKICFATIKILFMKDSTEGVAEGQTTASAGRVEIKSLLRVKKQNE